MAQYRATYACGHSEIIKLYGKETDRAERLKYLRAETCPTCRQASYREQSQDAQIANAISGLPSLTGTDKQSAWAETIRKTKITDIDAMIAGALADPQAQEEPVLIAALQAAARAVRDQTSAAWWIDRRDSSARSLVRDMARGQ